MSTCDDAKGGVHVVGDRDPAGGQDRGKLADGVSAFSTCSGGAAFGPVAFESGSSGNEISGECVVGKEGARDDCPFFGVGAVGGGVGLIGDPAERGVGLAGFCYESVGRGLILKVRNESVS